MICGKIKTVIQDIFTLLYQADIVVVDFSGSNPNVMYETGIAHLLGIEVVPLAQNIESDVPFDMRHHRVLQYVANKQGLEELAEKSQTSFSNIPERCNGGGPENPCPPLYQRMIGRTSVLLDWIHAGRGDATYQRRLHQVGNVALLVLDDFGLTSLPRAPAAGSV